eukprot:jgi/Bigna1/136202/aug1.32_g10910
MEASSGIRSDKSTAGGGGAVCWQLSISPFGSPILRHHWYEARRRKMTKKILSTFIVLIIFNIAFPVFWKLEPLVQLGGDGSALPQSYMHQHRKKHGDDYTNRQQQRSIPWRRLERLVDKVVTDFVKDKAVVDASRRSMRTTAIAKMGNDSGKQQLHHHHHHHHHVDDALSSPISSTSTNNSTSSSEKRESCWGIAWHPSGDLLATCGSDKKVRIWEQRLLSALPNHHHSTEKQRCHLEGGQKVKSQELGSWVNYEEVEKKKEEEEDWLLKETLFGDVKCVRFHPCLPLVASSSYDATIRLWIPKERRCSGAAAVSLPFPGEEENTISDNDIYEDEGGGGGGGDDENNYHPRWILSQSLGEQHGGHRSCVWSVVFEPNNNGSRFVSVDAEGRVILWKSTSSVVLPQYSKSTELSCNAGTELDPNYSVDWSSDGRFIAIGRGDDSIVIIAVENSIKEGKDGDSLKIVCVKHNAHARDVHCVKWNPKIPTQLASVGGDGHLKIWQMSDNILFGAGRSATTGNKPGFIVS